MTDEQQLEVDRPEGDSSGVYLGVSAADMGYGTLERVSEAPTNSPPRAPRWIAVALAAAAAVGFGIWAIY